MGEPETYPNIDSTKKITNNQHHTYILEANIYLFVCNVHFKFALSTEQNFFFWLIQEIHWPQ